MEYSEVALQRVREDRLLLGALDEWLFEEMEPYIGNRILEIGCGLGNFAGHLVDRDLYLGLEISEESAARVRSRFALHPNISAAVIDITTDAFRSLEKYRFDTVFSLNVFEHIEDDASATRNAAALLAPGGKLLIVVPAHGRLYGSIDRAIGHYRRYDKKRMASLFEQAGLQTVSMKYMNPVGALGWFVSGRIRRQPTPPSGQLRLFNVLVPILKRMERLAPMPFGISLLGVAERAR